MGMSKEEKRYRKAKQDIIIILEQYDDYDDLSAKRLEYKRNQHPSFRIHHANYVKYRWLRKIIEQFESNDMDDTSDEDYSFEDDD